MEVLGGFRIIAPVNIAYKNLIRSGPIGGFNGTIDLWNNWLWNSGISVFPTKNLENDPLYKNKPHRYSPFIWSVVSCNFRQSSLLDFIDFL